MRDRPMRRWTDRVEDIAAWLLTSTGVLVLIAVGVLGHGGYLQGMDRMRAEQASRVHVIAVLLQDPPQVAAHRGSATPWVHVPARWTDRLGQPRTGEVMAPTNARNGQQVPMWIGDRGKSARPPADRLSAVSNGLSVAIGLLIMGAGGIWLRGSACAERFSLTTRGCGSGSVPRSARSGRAINRPDVSAAFGAARAPRSIASQIALP
jgi:hypothetical protein